jgi:hypothetical protein
MGQGPLADDEEHFARQGQVDQSMGMWNCHLAAELLAFRVRYDGRAARSAP